MTMPSKEERAEKRANREKERKNKKPIFNLSIGQIFIKNFLKEIRKNGNPEITKDLKYVILTASIDQDDKFKIVKTTIVNSEGKREDVKGPSKLEKE